MEEMGMKKDILWAAALISTLYAPIQSMSLSFLNDPEAGVAASTSTHQSLGQRLTYDQIGKQNLKSLAKITEPKVPFTTGGNTARFIARQKTILLDISQKNISSTAFKIVGNAEKMHTPIPSIIDQTTWKDLNLLDGSEKNPATYLGSIINHTITALGKAYLLGTIARPIADSAELMSRQEIVKCLIKNQPLLTLLDNSLKPMAEGEKQLFSFWGKRFALPGTIFKQYWTITNKLDEKLNNNALALDIKSAWTNTQKCMGTAIQASSTILLTAYGIYSLVHSMIGPKQTPESLKFLEDYAKRFTGTAGPIYAILSSVDPTLQSIAALTAGIVNGLSLKSSIAWTKADMAIEAILQNKFVAIAQYIKGMKKIYELSQAHPTFFNRLDNFTNLARCVKNLKLKPLFDILASNTFSQESNYFFRRGNVLLACKLLQDKSIQKELEKGFAAIAEIDMYVSIAKLFNQFKDDRVKFCFPTYKLYKKSPKIALENYWNPFVDPKKVITNSINLGSTEQTRNGIITGPNSGGKSTILKSIALSIILAQSIGIAPAQSMSFTPFSHLATYMDISDDISNKTSLFQAEVDRAVNLQNTIRSLPYANFSFCIFDELFSGTSPDEGKSIAYATAEAIGQLPNSICMIATHFKLLTKLEANTKYFTNYKVSVEPGTLKRLYTLEPSISDQHIALDVARERGTKSSILDRASQILKEIS